LIDDEYLADGDQFCTSRSRWYVIRIDVLVVYVGLREDIRELELLNAIEMVLGEELQCIIYAILDLSIIDIDFDYGKAEPTKGIVL